MGNQNIEAALQLRGWGLNVLPAPLRKKKPIIEWRKFQDQMVPEGQIRQWFVLPTNYWVVAGKVSGIVVLDTDNDDTLTFWRARIPGLEDGPKAKTSKGWHFYFAWREEADNWSFRKPYEGTLIECEVRSGGGGIVTPPSLHESGHRYVWVNMPGVWPGRTDTDGWWPKLPDVLLSRAHAGLDTVPGLAASSGAGGSMGGSPGSSGSAIGVGTRSKLGELLAVKPDSPQRGNNWYTQVCGHFAALFHDAGKPFEFYRDIVYAIEGLSDHPQARENTDKTTRSVWLTEERKRATANGANSTKAPTTESGWLTGDGQRILVVTAVPTASGGFSPSLGEWADCDLLATGVTQGDSESERVYDVLVSKPDGSTVLDRLSSDVFADGKALRRWLARHGSGIHPPTTIAGKAKAIPTGEALRLYLESQKPAEYAVAASLGWHGNEFICYEGIIRADSDTIGDHKEIRPRIPAKGSQRYRYGSRGLEEARSVLREVLTFHDETIAAIFGAWWAAALVRPRLTDVSHFPIMGIEAPSGAAKTTGMFALLVSLSGNVQGPTVPTVPVLRDELRVNNAGIVWVDDATKPDAYQEIVRAVASSSSVSKKGENRVDTVDAVLRGSLLLSGETLALGGQQAMIERVVLIEPPEIKGRLSVRPGEPGRSQWDDVKALMRRYPSVDRVGTADLTVLSADVLRLAGQAFDQLAAGGVNGSVDGGVVEDWNTLRGELSGRTGDKIALLRLGARLLSVMTDDPKWIGYVDAWVGSRDASADGYNRLVLELLPKMLTACVFPSELVTDNRGLVPPVIVRQLKIDGPFVVLFSPERMIAYMAEKHWTVEARTDDAAALHAQKRRLGITNAVTDSMRLRIDGDERRRARYWRLPDAVSAVVLARTDFARERPRPPGSNPNFPPDTPLSGL